MGDISKGDSVELGVAFDMVYEGELKANADSDIQNSDHTLEVFGGRL